tara:strand:+ start:3462 stop:4844 length:1383 start_codon:yes stop_codon:yes gene_type:complete
MIINPGSFRDPLGTIYEKNNKVFRKVDNSYYEFCKKFLSSNFFQKNKNKFIVDTILINPLDVDLKEDNTSTFWLEHEKIKLISYPHEWGFETLKKAAIFHLELQKKAFESGFALKDASPYNVQFKMGEPIFIDLLSFENYQERSHWVAYKQFCENFLNPLLIKAYTGIDHNQFFRGSIDGIGAQLTSEMLPLSSWFSYNTFSHVHLAAWAQKKVDATTKSSLRFSKSGISAHNLVAFWDSLILFINKLKTKKKTYWSNYEKNTSYDDESADHKDHLVGNFVSKNNIQTLLDLGCNSGRYSRIAFDHKAKFVIGLDVDGGAIDKANLDKEFKTREFIALQFDLMNPSPAIGWRNCERMTLWDRLPKIDGIICLALIHHICIGKNVPMDEFIKFLFSLSKNVLIEFVPKSDPMVKGLLVNRLDVFADYSEKCFEKEIVKYGKIKNIYGITGSSRKLYECFSK